MKSLLMDCPGRLMLAGIAGILLFTTVACDTNMRLVKHLVSGEEVAEEEKAVETVAAAPAPSARKIRAVPTDNPTGKRPSAPIDNKLGSGEATEIYGGYTIKPPKTLNVFELSEGDDFRTKWTYYRWQRLSDGAWLSVLFSRGISFEGDRRPDIQDDKVLEKRIRAVFARIDEKHTLTSNGSRQEKIHGQDVVRVNVAGKVKGVDSVGHLYLMYDDRQLIEIAAVTYEDNRSVLKGCRDAANSFQKKK